MSGGEPISGSSGEILHVSDGCLCLMSGGRIHTPCSDVGTRAMGTAVLSCRGGMRGLRATRVRRGAATAAGWSKVVVIVVVSVVIVVIPVVVDRVLRKHTRN